VAIGFRRRLQAAGTNSRDALKLLPAQNRRGKFASLRGAKSFG
jgi:hypothetical protein